MTVDEALDAVMKQIEQMTPAELRAKHEQYRNSPFVQGMNELQEFSRFYYQRLQDEENANGTIGNSDSRHDSDSSCGVSGPA